MTIEAIDLSYSIGEKSILSKIELEIHPGKLHVLMGRNGAGKSSLFHILCGDISPKIGNIYLDGIELKNYSKTQLAKIRAVLTQDAAITFPISSKEVIELGRHPHISDPIRDKEIVQTCIKITGSTEQKDQNYSTLSGGEKQKINFGRILAQVWETPPRYIFLDEPVSALDIPNQYKMLNLCRHMADQGYAVFMILHDLNLAALYADTITLLHKGKIIKSGNPNDVLTLENLEITFGIKARILNAPEGNFIIPEIIGESI
ncbi:heme ABC transporter ATP-binding protein [Leptospira sp. 2 VSF19]|uniref:Heme ABC transporter ATP-binding protein n=1 Tax=Leptospira soteropolitanensis TaxID=2950025 RepID=A0AAW5VPL2_9LEPT|nr:heme ABC transporter ATP-binding protein [Leptospira soteropolitanensis]MCW7492505.1 heme ABC transporter ATP-binding protein [Leptospira soteropolitanensis]MCW7500554.1 heme ABC transporter ATP-binding protein [Leptospira soteropolitanensis]MCW7522776.1 heme ABC transporter ATP-binding protein [Leptospira soteropolitanensis]MCW7526633.1 heme ABC transporter ATP-binding protein [Leptospira soteropolitanensis]MCW7530524.1 heme ABC transporter ATP-binding protein [Leptospira soteropolitanensi